MSGNENAEGLKRRHRGRSSESFLDKDKILASLSIKAGEVILDGGCGNGYMAKEFARLTGKTGKVYAVDVDAAAIDSLKSECEGTIIEPFAADITKETMLAAASIDLIYLCTVVHGFSETQMEGFLKEVKRLLKADARLAIVEIKKKESGFGPPLEKRFSPEELKRVISLPATRLADVGEMIYIQVFCKQGLVEMDSRFRGNDKGGVFGRSECMDSRLRGNDSQGHSSRPHRRMDSRFRGNGT